MGRSISCSICAFFVLAILWTPARSNDACSAGCTGGTDNTSFQDGHKYTYAVEGEVDVYLTSAEKQQTKTKLNAQVSVAALGNCALVLRVTSLQLTGPDGKKYGKPAGIEKPVRFTLQNGLVGAEICTEEGDNQRSINIKRAIISLLGNSAKPSIEAVILLNGLRVDVFGVCPTHMSWWGEGGTHLLHSTRDLSQCAHREQGKHDLMTSIYNPKAEIKSTNILQSTLNVESKVKNGVLEKVSATEEYLYMPFSVGHNGARARVVTKLTLSGQSAGTDTGAFKNKKSIIFENPHPVNTEHSNQINVLSALKSTAQSLQGNAGAKSAGIFAQLVKIFRVTNKEDLLNVFNQIKAGGAVKDNKLAKKVFLDALLRAGTGDSIEVSIKLLQDKELSAFEQKLVLLSLGNVRHATNEAVVAVATLLDQPNLPKEMFLGAGALAGAYCREHACHAANSVSPGVAALAAKFGAKIGNCHTKSKHEEDQIVAILKGIRNVRHIENSLVDKLAHCVTDNNVKARVKVAALEAFHADPCTSKLKKTAIDTMKNRQLDSEIRIKAYLALLDCPCAKVATEVKNLLDTEPVQQVGRFITSSLRFIRATANPDRELAKLHLGQIRSPQKFNVDDRKYSHYRELSYNIDLLGLGASAEQTIIFSQDSFLPRSTNLNLTTQVFGHSFNLIDVAVRQGNVDRVLEHFFGPKGYFKSKKPQEIYDNFMTKISEVQDKLNQHLRGRRAVQQEIANFAKQVKGDLSTFHDELDLDIYVKIFGTDAVFLSLGDDKGFSIDAILEKVLKYFDAGAKDAKHFSHEVRSHILFLDSELSYPTSVGLPLKLNLIGSATARVEVGGSFDMKQIIKNPGDAKVDLKLIPSTNIEVAGTFVVDADLITTGLKVVSNLHTSTGGHFVVKVLDNGKGVDLQLALPVEKEELLTVTNDVIFVTNEKGQQETEVPLKIISDRTEYKGCFDQLSGAIGLTFCGLLDVPFKIQGPDAGASFQRLAARYPLTGPSKLSVHLEKNDLKNYHIKGLIIEEGPRRGFDIVLEAEGAKTKRRTALSGEYVFSDAEKKIKLNLESPIKSAGAEVSFVNNQNELSGHVNVKHDSEEYFGRVGFKVAGNAQRSVYTPLIEYKLPGSEKKTMHVEGQVVRESQAPSKPGNKYSFNGIKINMPDNNEKINIDGYVANEPRGISGELKAVKGDHKLSAKGAIDGPKYNLEFQNTLNPFINFKADLYTINEKGHVQNDLNLVYGSDLNSKTNKLSFNQNLKYHYERPNDFGVITKNHISCPALQIEGKFDGEIDPKKIDIDVETKYQGRKADFELEARTEVKEPGDYVVKFEASLDDRGVEFFAKRDIVSADKSNLENVLTIKPGGKYEMSGVVNHKVKPHDVNVGAVGHIKIAGRDDDIKFDTGVVYNTKEYSAHSKVSAGASELVNFLLKLSKGKDPHGELKLNLKDAISANGQYHVTSADGIGNGVLIVDFKRLGKKLKGDTKFTYKTPICSADVDLFLDFEKDNANKIHFSTNTVRKEGHLDTKNVLDFMNKKYQLNAKADYSGELKNGKRKSEVTLELPERTIAFQISQEVTDKDKVINGNADLAITDKPKSGQPSSLTYKGSVANLHKAKDLIYFTYNGLLDISLRNEKKLTYAFDAKHNPDGTLDFKTDLSGNIIPKPASLSGNMKYKIADNNIDGDHKTHIKGNYGSDASFLIDMSEDVQLINAEDKKYVGDYSLQLNLPIEKAHDIKLTSNIMFLIPKDKEVLIEYNLGAGASINADSFKVDSVGKVGLHYGFEKIKVIVPHQDPFTFDTSYKFDKESKRSGSVEIKSNYGKGKSATVALTVARPSASEYSVNLKAHAPGAEKLKNLEISIVNKNPEPSSASSHIVVDVDGKVYKVDVSGHYSRVAPLLDIKYTKPDSSKPSRIYAKGSNLNEHGGHVEMKIENIRDFDLDYAGDIRTGKDGITINMNINSPKLNLVKFQQEITTKDSPNGKRLEFHTTNNGKNVVSGSTSYISKQEGSKTIMEGSGTLKVKEEQKSATFKYIRDLLTEGQEQGIEEFMNVVIGERSIVLESRITNLEYKLSNVYCEEKKQCAHAELNSKIVATPGLLQHTVNIGLDLRKLGFSPEFGLQMSSEASEHKLPQYLLDVHLNQEQNKYHLHAYSQPKNGAFPAGITITLPKRVIALESSLSFPEGKKLPFPLKGDVAFYLNKNNQPQQKAALRLLVDLKESDKQHTAVAELGLHHPALNKEALLNFKASLTRPDDNSFRVESLAQFSHPAFGSDKKSSALFEVSPKTIKLKLESPLVEIVNINGNADISKDAQKIDVDFALLQGKPVHLHFAANNFQSFELTTGYKDQGGKLSVIGHLEPEKRLDLSTDLVLPNEKKNIFKVALLLQDNNIRPEYSASNDNFKYFTNAVKNDLVALGDRLKQLVESARAEAKTNMERATAALKKVADSYKNELAKLKDEVVNDKTLEEVNKALHSIVHMFAVIVNDIIEATTPIVAKIDEQIRRIVHSLDEFYKAQLPSLKKLFDTVSNFIKIVVDDVIDIIAEFVAIFQTFIEKYKPQINELSKTIAEIFKDLGRLLFARLKELRKDFANLLNEIIEKIKNLPVIEMLKDKIAEFQVPEQVLAGLEQLHVVLKDLLPTPESKNLADAIFTYTNKKLRQVKVDDQAELRVIYEKTVSALYSLVSYVRGQVGDKRLPSLFNINLFRLSDVGPISSAPLFGSASFSPINFLRNGDFSSPLDIIRAYRPRGLLPEFPAKLNGVVVNGQHIFTFDGRHLTFPGSCRYVLAHDHGDNNFTVALQLQNGQPKSIVLSEKSGQTIEMKENGQVTLNGVNHGFPIREGDTYAFRMPNTGIGMGSRYGVKVLCSPKLTVCYIEVNGFYLGKLRGLLGDGNNEEFDDFRLPNGKIATNEAEFGNAYRLASSCPQVKTPNHHNHQEHGEMSAACEVVFGGSSPLRPLFLLQDPKPFKQACAHATSANPAKAQEEACDIGRAFAAKSLLPVVLPNVCLKCHDGEKAIEIGDVTKYNIPKKQADIIVTIELTKGNEQTYKDLVVPLVGQIVDQLKSKKIDDLKVYLIGITSQMPYAVLYDTENVKLKGGKPQFTDTSRENRIFNPIKTGCEKMNKVQDYVARVADRLQLEFGVSNVIAGYNHIGELPLRSGAIKTVISVASETCKKPTLPFKSILSMAKGQVMKQYGVANHLITVTPDLKVGAGVQPNQIVGFDKSSVVFSDKKHKNTEEIRSTLEIASDACIDFVQETGGFVFSATNYQATAAPQRKQFLHAAAHNVVDKMLKYELETSCRCVPVNAFWAKNVCVVLDKKEAARRR